jgi:hypothetical protein
MGVAALDPAIETLERPDIRVRGLGEVSFALVGLVRTDLICVPAAKKGDGHAAASTASARSCVKSGPFGESIGRIGGAKVLDFLRTGTCHAGIGEARRAKDDLGDPCDGPKEIACSTDSKQRLRCVNGADRVGEACRNAWLSTSGHVLCR